MTGFVRVAPPEDGLVAAMSAARGRRYRKAGMSSGFAAAALSCLALLAGSSGTQTLIQEPRPELPAVIGVDETPHVDQTDPDRPDAAVAVGRPNTAIGAGPALGAAPLATTGPLQDPTYPARPLLTTPQYKAGAMSREDESLRPEFGCNVEETSRGLCTTVTIGTPQKGVRTLEARVCSTRASATTLSYSHRDELDFVVTQQGEERWRWSTWHPRVEQPHQVHLATGDCTVWRFDWTGVGFDGAKLPKGTYYLKARFLADELRENPVALQTFTIS